jgi:small nuclear ribonucleoprotein D3
MSVGVPIKLLHEAKHHVVTVELKTGELYRGYLIEAEDNMNCRIDSCQLTSRDGKTAYLEQVYLRGAQIRFMIVPDMFKNAPMFKRVRNLAKGKNQTLLRAKAQRARGNQPLKIRPGAQAEERLLINLS